MKKNLNLIESARMNRNEQKSLKGGSLTVTIICEDTGKIFRSLAKCRLACPTPCDVF